jgi:hypothetical protein
VAASALAAWIGKLRAASRVSDASRFGTDGTMGTASSCSEESQAVEGLQESSNEDGVPAWLMGSSLLGVPGMAASARENIVVRPGEDHWQRDDELTSLQKA